MDHQAFAQMLGNYGEFVGAIAVVVTLAYLAVQIKQNNSLTTTAIYESAMNGFININQAVLQDAELSSIARRGLLDLTQLNEEEAFRFNTVLRNYCNHLYKLYRLREKGAFPTSEWNNAAAEAVQILSTDAGAVFRRNNEYFKDLFLELEGVQAKQFSSFTFDEK